MIVRAHIVVSGLVQGVGYRYFAQRNAVTLGLAGYARNIMTGEVEIEAQGERGMIEELIKQLKIGPRSAMVNHVAVEWVEVDPRLQDFYVE
ncbi:MAG TPA: acylphosphatase [Candidatus Kapabacteria bacterium]|nr:acylphosphatase [Candidatus Kapabacteria bacterium]